MWCGLDRCGSGEGHVEGCGKQVMKLTVALKAGLFDELRDY